MSTDQESPPAQNETTSKDSSSTVQNLTLNTAANEPETGSKPDSSPNVPQAENETTSQNPPSPDKGVNNPKEDDTGTSKQGSANEADSCFQETKPAENETSKSSDSTRQAAATSKQETDHAENLKKEASPQAQEIKLAENETPKDSENTTQAAATRNQEIDDAENLKNEGSPQAQEIKPAENETPKDSESTTQAAATSDQEIDCAKNHKNEANPQAQEINPAENETPKDSGSTTQATATSKQETDDAENIKKEAISHAQEIKPVQNETPKDSDNTKQATATSKQETDDAENLKKEAIPQAQEIKPAENETPKDYDNTKQATATSKQETDDAENLKKEAIPQAQEIKSADNETSKDSDNTEQATATSKQKNDDAENLKKEAIPQAQEIKPAENETPKDYDNTKQATATSKQETDDAENLKKEAIPQAQEIKLAENETPKDSDNTMQAAATSSQETDDAENLKEEASPQAHTRSQETDDLEEDNVSQTTGTRSQETEDLEHYRSDAVKDDPGDQTIPPLENEATAGHPSSPNNFPTQSLATTKPEKASNQESTTKDADSLPPVNEITPDENMNTVKCSSLPTDFNKDADSKKSPFWKKFRLLFKKRSKNESGTSTTSPSKDESGTSTTSPSNDESETSTTSSPKDKEALANLINADIDSVNLGTKKLKEYNDHLIKLKEDAGEEFHKNKENHVELRESMIKLKLLIPSTSNIDSDSFKSLQSRLKARDSISQDLLDKMPQLHKNDIFYGSPEFKDFKARFDKLEFKLKLCLLCFSIFPGNDTIRKRLMVRWWVAEGLSSEEEASEHFLKLRKEGFIVPVNDNRSLYSGRYRMHPLYRSMLKKLAEDAKFFNFDNKGEPTQNYTNCFQACLVGDGLLSYGDLKDKSVTVEGLEKIHLVMNVNEPILDFKPHWFSMMRNVNVLYLGRWQASDAAHIEVEETNFLDGLKNMNFIKFLSLQGISNIIKLTESILSLTKVECLDLRACHNLEAIPAQIGVLKSLTHLDMSECYLLDQMPKSLSSLTNLRVFKGFVVSERNNKGSCTLADLEKLENLTKLCIYTTSKQFPDPDHVSCLEKLNKLRKLTIAWGGDALKAEVEGGTSNSSEAGGDNLKAETERDVLKSEVECGTPDRSEDGGDSLKVGTERESTKLVLKCFPLKAKKVGGDNLKAGKERKASKLPPTLEKLDLKCFPLKATPSWLLLENLKDLNLKKLYIRGGRFSDLGQYQDTDGSHTSPHGKDVWKVEVLRLKYLSNLEMEWRQLHELFPRLVYLEQVSCPKLTLFNCGARGVWIDQTKLKAWEKGQVSAPNELQPQTDSARAERGPTTSIT